MRTIMLMLMCCFSSCRQAGHGCLFLQKSLFLAEKEVAFRESLGSPEGGAAYQEKQEKAHPGETEAWEPEEDQVQEEVLPDGQEGDGTFQKILFGKHKKRCEREQGERGEERK